MNKLLILIFIIFSIFLKADTLVKGANIVRASQDVTLSKDYLKDSIEIIYGLELGTWVSFNPKYSMSLNSLKKLTKNKNYIIIAKDSFSYKEASLTSKIVKSCVPLDKGLNITELFDYDLQTTLSSIDGSILLNMFGVKNGTYVSYSPDPKKKDFNSLKQLVRGQFYIVDVNNSNKKTCTIDDEEIIAAISEFAFEKITVNPNSIAISNTVSIYGIYDRTDAKLQNDYGAEEFSIVQNGFDTQSNVAGIRNDDKLNIKVKVGNEPSITKLTVEEQQATFIVEIDPNKDLTPNSFNFLPKNGVDINSTVESEPVLIQGIDSYATVYAASLNANLIINGKDINSNYSLIKNGDTIRLKVIAPSTYGTKKTATLYVGGVSNIFVVSTSSVNPLFDNQPNDFDFTPIEDVDIDTNVSSETITILGINMPTDVYLDEQATLIINGKVVPNSTTVNEFDTIQIIAQSSSKYLDEKIYKIQVGTLNKEFMIKTQKTPINIYLENQRYRKDKDVSIYIGSSPLAALYEITKGRLPQGLHFDFNEGRIYGKTGKENEEQNITFKLTSSNGQSAVKTISIKVGDYNSTIQATNQIKSYVDFDDVWYRENKKIGTTVTFVRYELGFVKDSLKNIWQDNLLSNLMTHDEAVQYCENLEFGGYDKWKLPTIEELNIINNKQNKFIHIGEGFYWTSTPVSNKSNNYWYVDFKNGGKNYYTINQDLGYVRCITK
ncbi:MAG: DUF1566 domain-containing protein [Campylobacterales bacterium]|nr:DUF1566 domain-containing protein [Campylobacterales bacterium]